VPPATDATEVACGVQADELEAATLRSFRDAVGVVVRDVPPGRVTTYGEVATWVGRPGAARQVGAALRSLAAEDPDFPWQRVINAQGGISTYRVGAGELQEALLRREGVEVRNGRVELRRYRFRPTGDAE
jgi:methylated-DNA-protein-cysteine methyltransferase-like protein